ncbi:MAG: ABC transporter permease [Pyrinomonadaceae bacterium]
MSKHTEGSERVLEEAIQIQQKHRPDPEPADPTPGTLLPEEPLVVIEPSHTWAGLDLRDFWRHRELLYFMIWRDLKVRYKQTVLGLVWVVMQPLLTTVVFTVFLGLLARVPSDGTPYPLLAFSGLLPWTFFANSVANGSNSLVVNAHLLTKVYFPRLIIPVSAVGGRLVDFGVSCVLLGAMMLFYGVPVGPGALMLVPLMLLLALLALGASLWASALNVKYRDVGIALPVLIQLWMFVSPVVYSPALVPPGWRRLYSLNPLAGIIEGFRSALFGRPFDWPALASAAAVTLALLVYSAFAFKRMEKTFADLV